MGPPRRLDSYDLLALDHIQRLAILEALVTIGTDLEGEIVQLTWGIEEPELVALMRGATSHVASLRAPQQVNALAIGVALRLPAPELRDRVFFTMAALAVAGGGLEQLDSEVLVAFVIAFGISADRLAMMKAELAATAPA